MTLVIGDTMTGERPPPHLLVGDLVRAEDVEAAIACGPGAEHHHEAARAFAEAGSTRLALVQIGGAQDDSLGRAETELLPALKEL